MGNREIAYGYEVLIENLMDPAHVPYAHRGIMNTDHPKDKLDREGGTPLELSIEEFDVNGFTADQGWSKGKFMSPSIFYVYKPASSDETKKLLFQKKFALILICIPVSPDALVIAFRKWLKKYAGGQVDWRGKYSGALPPTPPREQLLDRYWSHVVNCKSCNLAYKSLNVAEVVLQIISVAAIGIVAAMKQGAVSAVTRNSMVVLGVLSFVLSRLLAHFIYKYLRYHDYNHAFL
ncbi:protochlorophyllide-dependent translocon component chloroplastic-like [Trifolium pratense]|uniref:Protochlorophyllide-dependent translocon component chloroplastic-like n=1 Tax=Trifolium pratense TaxID=57577 RepID=A0A2K3NI82_TRIPR|nr:protochlorophyllide-dependent translocon component chloroplastic-like [Trifolium pratense]